MANQLDSFSAQIVNYVRTGMSDEAVLELVKNKLGVPGAAAPAAARPRAAAAPAAAPAAASSARRGKKASRKGKAKSKAKAKAAPRAARAAASAPAEAAAPAPAGKAKAKTKTKAKAKVKPARRKKSAARAGGNREQEMETIEKTIKGSKGMSASEISEKTKIPQSRVSAHVRVLKGDKRIFQGGDRRFARYAGDQKTAEQASEEARKNASGPRRS